MAGRRYFIKALAAGGAGLFLRGKAWEVLAEIPGGTLSAAAVPQYGSPMLILSGAGTNGNVNGAATQPATVESGSAKPQEGDGLSRGLVAYLAVAPELSWTSLPSKPLMVPLFHELIRQGLSVIIGSQKIAVGDQPAVPH